MENVQLISELYIKGVSVVANNLDAKYISPSVMKSQEIGLQPLIGSRLYKKICSLVRDNEINLEENADYKTLLDVYITPYLTEKVIADLQLNLFTKTRNEGNVQYVDNNTQQTTLKDIQFIIQSHENDALFYATRLTDYLNCNISKYPEFKASKGSEMRANKDAKVYCNIVL